MGKMSSTLLLATLVIGAFASASVLDNGLDLMEAIPDLGFDQDKVPEDPKGASTKHRNPFAKMFPQFVEQTPVSQKETGED